jgi:hypothetical protein
MSQIIDFQDEDFGQSNLIVPWNTRQPDVTNSYRLLADIHRVGVHLSSDTGWCRIVSSILAGHISFPYVWLCYASVGFSTA